METGSQALLWTTIYKEVKESIGLGPEDGYFNSGVASGEFEEMAGREHSGKTSGILEGKGRKAVCQRSGCDQWDFKGKNSAASSQI